MMYSKLWKIAFVETHISVDIKCIIFARKMGNVVEDKEIFVTKLKKKIATLLLF